MLISSQKKRKNAVNEIERVYVEEGVFSQKFTNQLIDFIGFVLNRYSPDSSFPDDMVHFTYLRVLERLGGIIPEKPKFIYPMKTKEDWEKNKKMCMDWHLAGKQCLFDAKRSNLGNYIFSIARHAHSNFTYHNSKKLKELEPPPTEIPENEKLMDVDFMIKLNTLEIYGANTDYVPQYLPENLRRFISWKQNA